MIKVQYVMRYLNGLYVQRDDSTGPMSTGGYPTPVPDIEDATVWDDLESAMKYQQMFIRSTPFEIFQVTVTYSVEAI